MKPITTWKKGDVFEVTGDRTACGNFNSLGNKYIRMNSGTVWDYDILDDAMDRTGRCTGYDLQKKGGLILCDANGKRTLLTNTNSIMDSIKGAFVNLVTPEPLKSFRKAGVVNGDNLLTEEGQAVFLSWLLKKNETDFNAEVVQPILKEQAAK